MKQTLVLGCLAAFLQSCSGGSAPNRQESTGGAGASMSSGGAAGALGTPSSGGLRAQGGNPSAAGSGTGGEASGGSVAAGGTPFTSGGTAATGGSVSTQGGSQVTGGTSSGGQATGGTSSSSGGSKATGGASPNSGGSKATGGSIAGGSAATGGSSSGSGGAAAGGGLLAPATGALLGGFIGAGTIEATEAQIGRKWAIQLQYFDWPADFVAFARSSLSAGRIPYVTWEPWTVALEPIAAGMQDATIQSRATAIKALSGKVMLRFAHEMNGNWYPWDGAHNGANVSAPAKYIAAYRHIHDVFANAGVSNVLWVFCPNVDSVPNEAWNAWQGYYPGDAYVDWMCYDGYNWETDTFASMTSRIYPTLAAKNKPILLGETSTHDAEKAAWISAIIPAMKSQFPMVKALVWFHVNKENDWRYDSTQNSLNAFLSMAKDPYFNP